MELPFELVYTPKTQNLSGFPQMRDAKDLPILATAIMEGLPVGTMKTRINPFGTAQTDIVHAILKNAAVYNAYRSVSLIRSQHLIKQKGWNYK